MFRLSQRMFLYILVAVIAMIIAPHPMPAIAQTPTGIACAATPNTLGGQGFTLSGQGFTLSGQGFTLSGQGFTLSGQGFTLSGQSIDPEQVAQEILDNQITPDWFAQLLPELTSGAAYNTGTSALVVVDDQDHGGQVLAVLNLLTSDPRIAPYMSNVQIHFLDIGTPTINYEANNIAAAISTKVTELQTAGIQHIVLNMSFGFIPCDDEATGFNFDNFLDEQQAQQAPATPQGVIPILECVYKVEHNSYVARFGYMNDNEDSVYVSVGNDNKLSPSRKNGLLPTLFEAGHQYNVFEIPFDGRDLEWSLRGPDGNKHRVTANRYSETCSDWQGFPGEYEEEGGHGYYCENRDVQHPVGANLAEEFNVSYNYVIALFCGDYNGNRLGWGQIRQRLQGNAASDVVPILECVAYDGEQYIAHFGYDNPNANSVYIPVGHNNRFEGRHQNKGQPTYFIPGLHSDVFEVPFTDNLVWKLRSPNGSQHIITATSDAAPCLEDVGYSIWDYMNEVLGMSNESILENLRRMIMNVESDSDLSGLRALLRQYLDASLASGNTQTVFTVASSGNYRPWLESTPIPLVPARWSETIATGATLGNDGGLWQFSQDSNVRAPGAGYMIAPDLIVSGTSFAAPGLSLALAQYGTYPAACVTQEVGGIAYPPLVNLALTNSPLTVDATNPLTCYTNFAPTAVDDTYTVTQGETLSVAAAGVLVNDTDPDGQALTASLVTAPLYGALNLLPDGSFTYTHNGGYEASDSFVYQASDGEASDTATVTITIEPNPLVVESFTLINADTNEPIEGYDPIPNNGELVEIDLTLIGTRKLSLRANVVGDVRSVVFAVNSNESFRIENTAPFSLNGDDNGNYNRWDFERNVDYLVRATPYAKRDGQGLAGESSTILLRFIESPVATPEVTPVVTPEPQPILVESFTLINADSNEPIEGYDPIPNNGELVEIDLTLIGTHHLSLRANVVGDVRSVVFNVNSPEIFRVESTVPFSLNGDDNGNYNRWDFTQNVDYLVRATPFSRANGQGNAGIPGAILLRFVDSSVVTPEPVVTPEVTPEITPEVTVVAPPSIGVVSFTLINAETNQPVVGYDPIPDNAVIDVSLLGTQFNIRANTTGEVGSVIFSRNGQAVNTENTAPFALAQDDNGNYYAMTYELDTPYLIAATPHVEDNAAGVAGTSTSVTITFVDNTPLIPVEETATETTDE